LALERERRVEGLDRSQPALGIREEEALARIGGRERGQPPPQGIAVDARQELGQTPPGAVGEQEAAAAGRLAELLAGRVEEHAPARIDATPVRVADEADSRTTAQRRQGALLGRLARVAEDQDVERHASRVATRADRRGRLSASRPEEVSAMALDLEVN